MSIFKCRKRADGLEAGRQRLFRELLLRFRVKFSGVFQRVHIGLAGRVHSGGSGLRRFRDAALFAVGKLTAEYGKIGGNLNQIARCLNEYRL